MAQNDSSPRPNLTLDPDVARRFQSFARSFADEERLSDEDLTGADLRAIADWIEASAGMTIVRSLPR